MVKGAQQAVLLYADETGFQRGEFVVILCGDFVVSVVLACLKKIFRYHNIRFVAFLARNGAKLCKRFYFLKPYQAS
jgi:hypothetical protein